MEGIYKIRGKDLFQENTTVVEIPDVAIIIDKNRSIWGLEEDIAKAFIGSYEGDIETSIIPGTDYIIIYDSRSVLEMYGHRFIPYDCIIMKSTDKGLKGISADEIDDVRRAYRNRTANYQLGPVTVLAYKIS